MDPLMMVLYDEGAGGGGNPPTPPGGDPPKPTGGDKPPEGKVGADGKSTEPDYKALHTELQTKFTKLETDHAEMRKTLSRQGNDLTAFKTLDGALKVKDPKVVTDLLEKQYGLKVRLDAAAPTLPNLTDPSFDMNDFVGKLKEHLKPELRAEMRAEFAGEFETVQTAEFKRKHPDWDDLEKERDSIRLAAIAKTMPYAEVFHLAAKAIHMPEALKAAGDAAVAQYQKELEKKNAGGLGGGGSADGTSKPRPEGSLSMDKEADAKRVLGRLGAAI